jgi:TPR repeat protein
VSEDSQKLDNILEILKENASANNTTAITTLGFMFFHGIIVEQSEILALNYFKKAA